MVCRRGYLGQEALHNLWDRKERGREITYFANFVNRSQVASIKLEYDTRTDYNLYIVCLFNCNYKYEYKLNKNDK